MQLRLVTKLRSDVKKIKHNNIRARLLPAITHCHIKPLATSVPLQHSNQRRSNDIVYIHIAVGLVLYRTP